MMGATSLCQKSSFDYDKICSGTESLSIKTGWPDNSSSDKYGVSSGKFDHTSGFYQSETSHSRWGQTDDDYDQSHRARGQRAHLYDGEFSSRGKKNQEFEFDLFRKYN